MKKVFLLNNCGTCQRIMGELCELPGFERQNIKEQNIQPEVLDWLKEKTGSYEALFSKQAMKYTEWGLKDKHLTEPDFRRYILEEYTFLKRPVIVDGEEIWVGNAPKTIAAAKEKLVKK
jgi:arsenate reductase